MGWNQTARFYSALALTGVSSLALMSGQTQGTAQIVRGTPDTLTLQLKGLTPAAVEVEIGGVVVAHRQLSGRASSLQIPISSAGLPPGIHEATVRLYDSRGRLLTTLRGPIELSPDPNAPITIIVPRHGTSVSGTVPIEVRVSGQERPYVSFFVDGQVRTLRNYPPYVYHWDTTRERNGWHTIEVWSFDGTQTFRSPIMRVLVNNPGGRTERQLPPQSEEQVGLNEPALAAAASEDAGNPSALWRASEGASAQWAEANRLSRPALAPTMPEETPSAPPQEAHRAVEPMSAPRVAYRTAQAPTQPSDAHRLSVPESEATPTPTEPPATTLLPTSELPESRHALRGGNASPAMRGQKLTAPQIALAPTRSAPAARPAARSAWLPITFGTRLPNGITSFEVLVDARPVSFDVAPRVQQGVPVVAIRHIIEEVGGKVRWDNQQKVATVELNGHTLTLDLRANRVQLDGVVVSTETALQIVNGRVMAPVSLLGKVLNAQLAFETDTHQLHINTQ
jgi:hypothetical protein